MAAKEIWASLGPWDPAIIASPASPQMAQRRAFVRKKKDLGLA
jgi:hypothetical protein